MLLFTFGQISPLLKKGFSKRKECALFRVDPFSEVACPTGNQEITSSFMEIDHEIFFYSHSLPFTDSRKAFVSF